MLFGEEINLQSNSPKRAPCIPQQLSTNTTYHSLATNWPLTYLVRGLQHYRQCQCQCVLVLDTDLDNSLGNWCIADLASYDPTWLPWHVFVCRRIDPLQSPSYLVRSSRVEAASRRLLLELGCVYIGWLERICLRNVYTFGNTHHTKNTTHEAN